MDQEKSFCQMLGEAPNFRNLWIVICWWTFTSSSYYLINFFMKYFKGSIYVNAFLFGFAGLLGVILFSVLLNLISTKKMFIISFFITFWGSMGFTLTQGDEDLVPIWILLMVMSLSIQFSLCYYTNIELFEPAYRTRIFSLWNIISRIFTMGSPMVAELMGNPIIIISIAGIVMIMLATQLKMPESPK